ncbi:MAG: hypothetical protein HKN49_12835, partial [Gammaproteobacteria bacterium]|nr:hypothetical protein [Gammaproteobacteria bacterium]
MAMLRTLLLLTFGIATGVFLTLAWLQHNKPDAAPAATEVTIALPPPATTSPASSPVVQLTITVSDGRRPLRQAFRGLVVGREDLVLVPSSHVAGARRIELRTASGDQELVMEVAASDDIHGLALLRLQRPLAGIEVLQPHTQGGSLRAGLNVVLDDGVNTSYAEVIRPANRTDLGAYFYYLRHR